jgi:hypothetical protein
MKLVMLMPCVWYSEPKLLLVYKQLQLPLLLLTFYFHPILQSSLDTVNKESLVLEKIWKF